MKRHPKNGEYSEIILDGNKMVVTEKRKYKGYTVVYEIPNLAVRAISKMQIFKGNM